VIVHADPSHIWIGKPVAGGPNRLVVDVAADRVAVSRHYLLGRCSFCSRFGGGSVGERQTGIGAAWAVGMAAGRSQSISLEPGATFSDLLLLMIERGVSLDHALRLAGRRY